MVVERNVRYDMYNVRPVPNQWINNQNQFLNQRVPPIGGPISNRFIQFPHWQHNSVCQLDQFHRRNLINQNFRPRQTFLLPKTVAPHHNKQTLFPNRQSFTRRKGRKSATPLKHLGKLKGASSLNPSDPLNLQDLMKETERRRVQGLSPLRGDSKMNTPVASLSGESPFLGSRIGSALTESLKNKIRTENPKSRKFNVGVNKKRFNRSLPKTGNYGNYYSRRDPKERLNYLMPEWFNSKDVADYGCHNGTMAFNVIEQFPDVHKIDGIDCDAELIANAKSMQRERIRWHKNEIKYEKINFQVADWVDNTNSIDEPAYDTILAFSVTKWIHLNHGDAGLMRFFRRSFNLLKPGGHLILEPQPKSSYKRTRFTVTQRANYRKLNIDPSNFEPLLLDLGFSYFDNIKIPEPNQPFKRHIMLCSKSYGATPASIRNDFRNEAQSILPTWPSPALSPPEIVREPPPVNYCPQTPTYIMSPAAIPAVTVSSTQRVNTIEPSDSNEVSSSESHTAGVVFNTVVESSEATPLLQPDHATISPIGNAGVIASPDSTMHSE